MSKLKQKSYRVYITQYVRPIDVMAVSTTQAKKNCYRRLYMGSNGRRHSSRETRGDRTRGYR